MMRSMVWLLSVSMVVLIIISTANSHAYDRSWSRDKTDSYGTYSYDRYGEKVYSRCYERDARPRDECRNYRAGSDRYRGNEDRYNRYDRDGDYYNNLRGKVNVGKGVFRTINGRDAELTCEFPKGTHLISNIVWEQVGNRNYYSRSSSLSDYLGRRMEVERIGDFGSVLIIRDWDERDTGIYRCLATRSYSSSYSYSMSYGRKETVYMEIDFNPKERSYRSRDEYSGYSSSRDDRYRPSRDYGYRPSSWWRSSAVKASEDTVVVDPNLKEDGEVKDKKE